MLARRSSPSNKVNSVILLNVMTCFSEYAGKGVKGGLGGNAPWTSVTCSVIGIPDFREGSCNCGEIIDCLFCCICSAGCPLCEYASSLLKSFDMRFFQTL